MNKLPDNLTSIFLQYTDMRFYSAIWYKYSSNIVLLDFDKHIEIRLKKLFCNNRTQYIDNQYCHNLQAKF